MGGRGGHSGYATLPAADLAALPYTLVSFSDERGGAGYPFLEQTGRAWYIVTHKVDALSDAPHPAHTFGQLQPTLRWVNGDQVNDLYLDGMVIEQFLQAAGLELSMHKGGFVLSKRLSRLMRPHRASAFFAADEVKIAYLDQTPDEAAIWDGAGLVSRQFLEQSVLCEELPQDKRERLATELAQARRVEFTVMTVAGQDKGHAIVADDLRDADGNPVDFLLPRDTKREVRLTNGRTFVGLSVVHGHDHMRLDIQSLINLHPFFDEADLLGYLQDEGALFAEAVETGRIGEVMGRIDPNDAAGNAARWPLKAYLTAGGHPLWFRAHVKALFNQHLKRLNHQQLEKLRLPIPGGRHYVMPAAIGRRAGYDIDVGRGEIEIDPASSTAWVNDDDWLALADSPQGKGIATILGGADNDDALWLHPFTDHDGGKRVLLWRSPNQMGEYLVLRPVRRSADLPYATTDGGHIRYPTGDSRKLPPRIDHTTTAYLNLVDSAEATNLTTDTGYTITAMNAAIDRALANQGALGMYCNSLMLNKALFGRLPDAPPAPLELIIDSAVKTGADLSAVVAWNYANSRAILEQRVPIPSILANRLSIDYGDPDNRPPRPRWTEDHWLARLQEGVQAHIRQARAERDRLAAQARPPDALFTAVAGDDELLALGRGLNRAFAATLKKATVQPIGPSRLAQARTAAEAYLSHFPPERQQRILLAALASVYDSADGPAGSDAVAWLAGDSESRWFVGSSIGLQTIEALRRLGIMFATVS